LAETLGAFSLSVRKLGLASGIHRETERQFWRHIAKGITSEKEAEVSGLFQAAGSRWFQHRGGMPLFMSKPTFGRWQ
jgi:hypothetical protein